MKFVIVFALTAACLVKFSEGYLCYECNSTLDQNCFDFSPKASNYQGVDCDAEETGAQNCYAVQISDRKVRRMYRGCRKAGICDLLDIQDENNIQMKVLECNECSEHYCNSQRRPLLSVALLILSIVTKLFVQ